MTSGLAQREWLPADVAAWHVVDVGGADAPETSATAAVFGDGAGADEAVPAALRDRPGRRRGLEQETVNDPRPPISEPPHHDVTAGPGCSSRGQPQR